MKLTFSFPVGATLASALIASFTHRACAQQLAVDPLAAGASPVAARTASERTEPWTSVLYDAPGDGNLWAVGASWKASFGVDGAVYFPRVGASEPRARSIALSPDLVTLGGAPIELARAVVPVREGNRVAFDRGGLTERYDLAADSVEQSFVFDALPRAGDLVLRIPLASDLAPVATSAGLELRGERGHVAYSRAVAIDALGRRTEADTRVEDGAITIRVAAAALADVALPLVVDPVLNAIFPDTTTEDTFSVDAAYDAFNGVWVVVYERVFSATDHDVIAKEYLSTGALVTTATIDATSDSWAGPRIADHASAHKFLVVAGATAAVGGAKTVRGRIAQPNGTLLVVDPQLSLSGALQGSCIEPDVGGHSSPSTPGTWCVVWERDLASNDHTIMYTLISSAGTQALAPQTLSLVVGMRDENASIGKMNGATEWTIAFTRDSSPSHGSIQRTVQGARVSNTGAAIGPFLIGGGPNAYSPCASSPIDGTDKTAVVFQQGDQTVTTSTTMVALLDDATVLQLADLKTLTGLGSAPDQIDPSVDSDGVHFLVSYSAPNPPFLYFELYAVDLAVAGNALQVAQGPLQLQPGLGLSQERSNVAAARATGTVARRYLVVYDYEQNSVDHDAAGRFVDGVLGGPATLFCSGDVTSPTDCPCGNVGASSHGCANSVFAAGALLQMSAGRPSTIADTAVLQASSVPPGAACIFFQGTASSDPVVLGDGLFCTTGTGIRLATKTTNPAGVASYPEPGNPPLSVRGAVPQDGGLRTYQVWYRNAASFCTSATFNVSNGVAIQWAR